MTSIVSQIEVAETAIRTCEERLDTIERSIRLKDLTDTQLQSLLEEEKKVKKRLKQCEKELKGLRKENGKNTVISVLVLAVIAFIYYTCFAS